MAKAPEFDVAAAHRYFAAECFNKAWDLIDKADRTPDEERMMVLLNQASMFHWLSRPDCDDKRLSIGYWQASRIQAVLRNGAEAMRMAELCLAHSRDLEPFYLGYAYEALARASLVAGQRDRAAEYVALSEKQAALVAKEGDRELLRKDLAAMR